MPGSHLDIYDGCGCGSALRDLDSSQKLTLKGCKSLFITSCLLKPEPKEPDRQSGGSRKKKRKTGRQNMAETSERTDSASVGSQSSEIPKEFPDGLLKTHQDDLKNLETLEIVRFWYCSTSLFKYHPAGNNPFAHEPKLTDDNLYIIGSFHHLVKLSLAGLGGIRHGKFLVTIATNCPKLESLSLAEVGPHERCVYENALLEALAEMKNLKDLRIEQRSMYITKQFVEGMKKCRSLRRLCIVLNDGWCPFELLPDLVEALPKLIFFFLVSFSSKTSCKKTERALRKRFLDSRPAFQVAILPPLEEDIRDYNNTLVNPVHIRGFVMPVQLSHLINIVEWPKLIQQVKTLERWEQSNSAS